MLIRYILSRFMKRIEKIPRLDFRRYFRTWVEVKKMTKKWWPGLFSRTRRKTFQDISNDHPVWCPLWHRANSFQNLKKLFFNFEKLFARCPYKAP